MLSLSGQSNLDMCLKTIGSFDTFVDFLNRNKITGSSLIIKDYIYDSSKVLNRLVVGYNFSTNNLKIPLLNNDGTPLLNNNGQPLFNN